MVALRVWKGGEPHDLLVPQGSNLRQELLKAGFSPYAKATQVLNCRGNGICATCGVEVLKSAPAPVHWHDKLADRWGYPRLSCQIAVDHPMEVRIMTEKVIWGKRLRRGKS